MTFKKPNSYENRFGARQLARYMIAEIKSKGLYGSNQPAKAGCLRGIDVIPETMVFRFSRAIQMARGGAGVKLDFVKPRLFTDKITLMKYFSSIPMPSPANRADLDVYIPKSVKDQVRPVPIVFRSDEPVTKQALDRAGLKPGKYYMKSNNASGANYAFEYPCSDKEYQQITTLTKG